MNKQLTSANGLPIILNYANMEDVEQLIQLIARKAKELNLTEVIKSLSSSMEEFLAQDLETVLPLLQQIICELESSEEFNNIVYNLLRVCTYNGIVITRQLFNDKPELREDFYTLKIEVIKFNLSPFLKNLSGRLFQMTSVKTDS